MCDTGVAISSEITGCSLQLCKYISHYHLLVGFDWNTGTHCCILLLDMKVKVSFSARCFFLPSGTRYCVIITFVECHLWSYKGAKKEVTQNDIMVKIKFASGCIFRNQFHSCTVECRHCKVYGVRNQTELAVARWAAVVKLDRLCEKAWIKLEWINGYGKCSLRPLKVYH